MWAFGCIWFEVLHMKAMFSGSIIDLVDDIRGVRLQKFEAECSKDFKKAIMQCFKVNPAKRPAALDFLKIAENVRSKMRRSKTERFFCLYLTLKIFKIFSETIGNNCSHVEVTLPEFENFKKKSKQLKKKLGIVILILCILLVPASWLLSWMLDGVELSKQKQGSVLRSH